ncbi:hypothetical protein QBC35DRAFT_471595 [Podospora australis]|uniref:Uncharacterized protein n=1 Tax=Podospora australis TaxID=1536484 RepID=A0AAN7AMC1_9PEZI|nr:hypothetical protein QBC35DRAFT_471595 [Podospora australis]
MVKKGDGYTDCGGGQQRTRDFEFVRLIKKTSYRLFLPWYGWNVAVGGGRPEQLNDCAKVTTVVPVSAGEREKGTEADRGGDTRRGQNRGQAMADRCEMAKTIWLSCCGMYGKTEDASHVWRGMCALDDYEQSSSTSTRYFFTTYAVVGTGAIIGSYGTRVIRQKSSEVRASRTETSLSRSGDRTPRAFGSECTCINGQPTSMAQQPFIRPWAHSPSSSYQIVSVMLVSKRFPLPDHGEGW